MMDKVAVVILNWNGKKMLARYLSSVLKFSQDEAVVYVADNASTDDSVAYLKTEFPAVRLILLEQNWGFAEGYNKALQQVEAEYFVLLNSDVEVTPHWLTPLIDFMDKRQDVAACQPKLLSDTDRTSFEYAGAAGGFIDRLGYPFCRGRIFEDVEKDQGQYDEACEVLWATGACLMVRASDYFKYGGLDARFFAHLTMLYKNLPENELRRVMIERWFLDYLAAFQTLLLNGNWGDFKAIFRARRAFRKWLPDFKADREKIQRERTVQRVPQRKQMSLLWQYYFHRRRTFAKLPERI